MSAPTRRRLADSELHWYEDAIARQLSTEAAVKLLIGLLDVSTLEEALPVITLIMRNTGMTRRDLIAQMNRDKDAAR